MYTKQNITFTQFQTIPTIIHFSFTILKYVSIFHTYMYNVHVYWPTPIDLAVLQLVCSYMCILVTSLCTAIMYLTLYMKIVALYASFFLHLEE